MYKAIDTAIYYSTDGADDQRIFEAYITMPDRTRAAFISAFSSSVYATIRSGKTHTLKGGQ